MAAETIAAAKAAAIPKYIHTGVIGVYATVEIAEALEADDVFQMVTVPTGAVILDVILATDDMDTGGTGLLLNVGFGGAGANEAKFIADAPAHTAANNVTRLNQVDGLGYEFTAEDTIDVVVDTAPTTGATSGTISLVVLYTRTPDD
jgi:hypothetical protein